MTDHSVPRYNLDGGISPKTLSPMIRDLDGLFVGSGWKNNLKTQGSL